MNQYETPIFELMSLDHVDIVTDSVPGTETPPIDGDGNWEL